MKDDIERFVYIQYYDSPCGRLVLGSVGEKLCFCDWYDRPCAERNMRRLARLLDVNFVEETTAVIMQAKVQLDEYFAGRRNTFDIPLFPVGTAFQLQVWSVLLDIPYGETCSYKDVALRINNLKGIRAVAQAIGANGISVFIPCHRVVGSDHSLTGFAGGLEAKRILLGIESENKCKAK